MTEEGHPDTDPMFHVKCSSETRVCPICKRERLLVLFANKTDFGLCCQLCRDTHRQRKRLSWQQRKRLMRDRTPTPMQITKRADRMWHAARLRAWRSELPFDLKKDWIIERLVAGKCEITGIEFDNATNYIRTNFAPSIEREDPDLGYVEGNCLVVVWIYNSAKGPGTHEDVVRMARALVAAEDERQAARTRKRQAAARASEAGEIAA